MKLDVPFKTQNSQYDCGPTVVELILDYLSLEASREEVEKALNYEKDEAVYTVELASAASELGAKTEFYTSEPFNKHDSEFYQEDSREASNDELYQRARESGVGLNFDGIKLEEILDNLSEDSIPIVLIDWNVIKSEEGYQGHFVPVVGYTDTSIIIHNVGDQDTGRFREIEKEKFREARESEGTDKDVTIISKSKTKEENQ